MSVLPGPFSSAALALVALLTAAQAGAAPDHDAPTPAARAAARAAVVAYNKQREEAQQELSADDLLRVQGVGQMVLAAQAEVQNSPEQESLRMELKALHDELEQAMVAASVPRVEGGMEITETTATIVEESRDVNARLRMENGKPVIVKDPQKRRGAGGSSRVVRTGKDAPANLRGDDYARVRARLDAMRPRVEAANAAGMAAERGNSGDRRAQSAHMAKRAGQLSDEVRTAVDASSTAENQRKLAELRDRLREKTLDEVIGVSSMPVTPTFTTLTQHR